MQVPIELTDDQVDGMKLILTLKMNLTMNYSTQRF